MPTSMLVLAHPRSGSFSHALAGAAEDALRGSGHDVARHDLYEERFDPVLPREDAAPASTSASTSVSRSVSEGDTDRLVARHRHELTQAHTLVVVHPNWWGKPPAIMAGWMDRVLAPEVVYRLDDAGGLPVPLLALERLVVLNTGDTDPQRETESFGDPLDGIWRRCVGAYLGDVSVDRLLATPLAGSSPERRAQWLATAARLAHAPE